MMMSKLGKWLYNYSNAESWCGEPSFDTREEAIKAGMEDSDMYKCFDVGQEMSYDASDFALGADEILELLNERAYDECGECAEDGMDLKTNEADFGQAMMKFIDQYIEAPSWFSVVDIETIQKVNKHMGDDDE